MSQYSATEDITEEENGFAISPDFEGGVELLSVANKSDELLQNLILMAKQMAGSIGKCQREYVFPYAKQSNVRKALTFRSTFCFNKSEHL